MGLRGMDLEFRLYGDEIYTCRLSRLLDVGRSVTATYPPSEQIRFNAAS